MFTIEAQVLDGATVLQASGEVDLSNARELELALDAGAQASHVILDLSHLEYLDSAGVRAFFAGAERVRTKEQTLLVVAPSGSPASMVLRVAGFAENELYEDLAAALASVRTGS